MSSKEPSLTLLPRWRIYIGEKLVFGPGKAELLQLIKQHGSLSEAARHMGMSYNRAWLHVKTMNGSFTEPLVTLERGGSSGGGAALTETGEKVLDLYQAISSAGVEASKTPWTKLRRLCKTEAL